MRQQKFNIYCATVMGYTPSDLNLHFDQPRDYYSDLPVDNQLNPPYDPYNNLNQLAEVVEKLAISNNPQQEVHYQTLIGNVCPSFSFQQAFRVFVGHVRAKS